MSPPIPVRKPAIHNVGAAPPPPTMDVEAGVAVPPPPTVDVQAGVAVPPSPTVDVQAGVAVAPKEFWMEKKAVSLILRALALLFSVISLMLLVTVTQFTRFPAINYVFIVVFVEMIYTAVFLGIHGHEARTGKAVIPPKIAAWTNFLGDQFLALMLLSAGSAGGDIASAYKRYGYPDADKMNASIAMTFFTFLALEPVALMSTYRFFVYITKS